jgi:hypothetical protein
MLTMINIGTSCHTLIHILKKNGMSEKVKSLILVLISMIFVIFGLGFISSLPQFT